MAKKETFQLSKKLDHVAFIMDGNGRWAKLHGLPRHLGHKKACEGLIAIYDACREFHIKVMSLYAFSTENWNRPQEEIDHLMGYLEDFFNKNIDYLCEHKTRVVISGDISRLPVSTQEVCKMAMDRTKNYDDYVFNVCLNYGGRDDIVRAAKLIAREVKEGKLALEDINEEVFADHLYTKGLPDVDLMIRTSGEQRLSNYLLYQNAYAEFVFTPTKWPDFDRSEFIKCLEEYQSRNRRFGGLKNE